MTPNPWFVLGALFLARTSLGYQFQSVGSVAPILVEEMGIDFTQVGTLIGLFSALGVLTALPAGQLGRMFGEKRVVLAGLAMMAAGGFIMGTADGFTMAAVGRTVVGAGGVVITVSMVKLVGDLFEGPQVITAMAILMNSWPVGITIGLWTQGALAEAWGWQAVFLTAGIGSLGGMILVWLLYRPPPRAPRSSGDGGQSVPDAGRISFREATLVSVAGVVWTMFNGAFLVVMAFGPALLVSEGTDVVAAGSVIGIGTFVYMLAIPLGGWLSSRFDRPNTVMLASFALAGITVATVPFVDAQLPLFILAGIFVGVPTGNVMALTVEMVRKEHRNIGTGLYYTWHYIGLSAVPAIAGWSVDSTGNAAAPMWVGAGCSALAILLLVVVRGLQSRFRGQAAA
ncbi:MAG: MFS transporter [Alphaproteobacteria bacterium]|nr:MFS transporter [Alphaproteobacteria bacterium]